LSVGRVCAFVGAISAMLYNTGIGMPATIVISIIIGLGVGVFQGFWIAFLKIPAFIVTLAGMLLFRGLTYIITNVSPISLKDDSFKQIASGMVDIPSLEINGVHYTAILIGAAITIIFIIAEILSRRNKINHEFEVSSPGVFVFKLVVIGSLIMALSQRFATYAGLPAVAIVLGVTILVFTFILQNTVIGRYIYAVGGNARSAKLSGINSELVVFFVHVLMGGLAGLAGVVFTGYMNSALPQAGENFELDAIAACFIGGASTSGGIGTVIGAIVGGLVMAAINNGMSLMNISAHWQYVVKASVLLLAVFYDIYTRRKSGLG
ncbi:MAG: sugar ABC transporter permease, partial [Treponemataceae bacterium]